MLSLVRDVSDAGDDRSLENEPVCATAEAARLLGVSTTTIQIMVRRGDLEAWRTRGGHRRITRASIEKLIQLRESRTQTDRRSEKLSIVIVEDDSGLRYLYEAAIRRWGLALTVHYASDGIEALLGVERYRPDVLVTDLVMQPMNGISLVKALRARPEFNDMAIVAVTGLTTDAIAALGGLPKGVAMFSKPVSFDKLQGFIEAAILKKELAAS